MKYRAILLVGVCLFVSLGSGVLARRQAPARVAARADAISLNNLGVASMNQQKPEAALERFEAAAKADSIAGGGATESGDRDDGAAALRAGAADPRRDREGRTAQRRAPGTTSACWPARWATATRRWLPSPAPRSCAPTDAYAHYFVGPHQQPAAAARQGDRRRSRARSRSIRSWSRPNSAWRGRTSAAGRPTRPRRTWIGSRG